MSLTTTFMAMEEDYTNLPLPANYIDFYGDPFSLVIIPEPTPWKGKGIAVGPLLEDEPVVPVEDTVEWTRYSPPAALQTAPNVHDHVLLHVLKSSIERVKARNDLEHGKREEAEAQQRQSAEEQTQDAIDDDMKITKEPYLPIIIPSDDPPPISLAEVEAHLDEADREDLENLFGRVPGTSKPSLDFHFKPKKSRKFKLARLLKRLADRDTHVPLMTDLSKHAKTSNSTIATESSSPVQTPPPAVDEVECVSCLDDFPATALVKVTCHSYCGPCFRRLITTACENEQQWPPKCCLNAIPPATTLAHIPAALQTTYRARAEEWALPAPDRIYCARPACSLFIPPSAVNRAARTARCRRRSHPATCTLCRGTAHPAADTCPSDRDAVLTEALAADAGWIRCGACHAFVEHREACQHMTCRCGHEFCYVCARPWKTCGCTMDDLEAKLAAAAARVAARLEREAEEEEAVRLVEEFEREERLKSELLQAAAELVRLEAERIEAEERARRELARRIEVKERFEGLRGRIEDLRELQDVLVGWQHDREGETLKGDAAAAWETLLAGQETERAELDHGAKRKVETREAAFRRDYASRVAEERDVEAKYQQELETFYEAHAEGEKLVGEAIKRFRREMDKGWRAWSQWRDGEMAAYQARVDEERAIREEGLYCANMRLEENHAEQAVEAARRTAAELQWVEEVWREREVMLNELEEEELEEGETGSWYSFAEEEEFESAEEASGSESSD